MTHYPSHERRAFLDWLGDGCLEVATVEENYTPREVSADDLLRRFLLPTGCSDVMPGHAAEDVASQVDYYGDVAGITYAIAAATLLIKRAAGADAGHSFLARLIGGDE